MQTLSSIPIINILYNQDFSPSQLIQAIKTQPQLSGAYPIDTLHSISSSLKQKHIGMIQTVLRDIITKTKFPCFYHSLRQLILLFHICILRNPNYSTNALQFIQHLITKMHLYVFTTIYGSKQLQLYDVLIYLSKILKELIPLLFEKGHFSLVLSSIISITEVMTSSIGMISIWILIDTVRNNLDNQSRHEFYQILKKKIKNKDSITFLQKAITNTKNMLSLDYLMLLRENEDSLIKSNFVINKDGIKKQQDGIFVWPNIIKQAYQSSPKPGCPFSLSSKSFTQVYDNLLLLQVYCNSPTVQNLQDYVTGEAYQIFVKFISGQSFIQQSYKSKLEKWSETLKQIQSQYKDKRKIQQLKQDILRLSHM